MKNLLAILIAFSFLQITPALAGLDRTNAAFTDAVKSAIESVEEIKGTQSDVLKIKTIKKDFDTLFENAWKMPRYKFYEYALEQYNSINKILKTHNLSKLIPPDWL